jgi:hypothetical protein
MAASKNVKKADGTQTIFGADHKVVGNIAAPKVATTGGFALNQVADDSEMVDEVREVIVRGEGGYTIRDSGEIMHCGVDVEWEDCEQGHAECYTTVCDMCGVRDLDCEEEGPESATGVVTSERPKWKEFDSEGGGYSDDGRVKVAWVDLGEGFDGDYDEDDEDDTPLLRYDAYVLMADENSDEYSVEFSHQDLSGRLWGQKSDSSFCTGVPAHTPRAELNRLAEKMADRLADNLDNGGWKGTAAELSWVGDSELARVRLELEKD